MTLNTILVEHIKARVINLFIKYGYIAKINLFLNVVQFKIELLLILLKKG